MRSATRLRCAGPPARWSIRTEAASQFRSHVVVRALREAGLNGSVGRVGADNAAMESFFRLQKNVLNKKRWESRKELRLAIITWIERTCHRRRRQDRLGRMRPIELDTLLKAAHAA